MEKMCAVIDEHWCQTQKLEDNVLHIQQRQHKATPTDQGEMLTEKYELLCIKLGKIIESMQTRILHLINKLDKLCKLIS